MDEKGKREMRARYLRGMQREVGYEEKRARKRRAAGRERSRTPRRHGWDEDEGADAFEAMGHRRPRESPPARSVDPTLPRAIVAAVHRGRVELDDGRRARLAPQLAADVALSFAVGDEVSVSEREGQPRVEALLPRRSVLARHDPSGSGLPKVIAANVDVGVITAAAVDPPLRPGLVDRMLVALGLGQVRPILCVTKVDLLDAAGRTRVTALLETYGDLGMPTFACSIKTGEGTQELRAALAGCTAVFVGHSGVGKSSLLNVLDPSGERSTASVRVADGRGRHTTTCSSLRSLGNGTRLIDTPGVRAFGLDALTHDDLVRGFPEFAEAGPCRFGDCAHRDEPDCAVRAAAAVGRHGITSARYRSYLRIVDDGERS